MNWTTYDKGERIDYRCNTIRWKWMVFDDSFRVLRINKYSQKF